MLPPSVVVLFQSVKWQVMQAVELSVKLLATWQEMQGVGVGEMCWPVRANPVVPWSQVAVVKATVVWHVEQFTAAKATPAVWCGGAFVVCQSVKWQPAVPHAVGAMLRL